MVPFSVYFFFHSSVATPVSPLSLHDALPISVFYLSRIPVHGSYLPDLLPGLMVMSLGLGAVFEIEEHTSELQSRFDLVCRLLLEKKKLRQHLSLSELVRKFIKIKE